MPINFSASRWDEVKKNHEAWWNHELERPLVVLLRPNAYTPSVPQPSTPLLAQNTVHDLSIKPKDIMERYDYHLSTLEFTEDSFPIFDLVHFGPGVLAAFLGARLDNSSGGVWFHPPNDKPIPIKDLHLEYDPNNQWLVRVKELAIAACEFWQGQVLVGMPDLGGVLDILASFRTSEGLLFDLYDEPDEVKRVTAEIVDAWYRVFDEFNELVAPTNPGYSNWSGVYSKVPQYIPQCDFAYMISNDMFREFALDTIKYDTERIPRTVFHLDGMGMLPHMDDILALPGLDCLQWVHGAGNRNDTCADWQDIHERVFAAGKLLHTYGGRKDLDTIVAQLGTNGKGIYHCAYWQ